MSPEEYLRVQELFLELREATESERVERLRNEDAVVRKEVFSLLKVDPDAGRFLKFPEPETETQLENESDSLSVNSTQMENSVPEYAGRYRLLQVIGEGGFGTVYLGEQKEPVHRKVAVKLIKSGMDSKEVLARFHAERQALALMNHSSIASVIDAGTTERGAPFFVMELVKGTPIHDFCSQNRLDLHERLELFKQICHAVHHAHQKGVIHRDLKPANVLVTMGEQKPLAKVIDFGIAKALDARLTEQTLFTSHGQMIGTLEYMSPEQAEMSAVDIDTRSDIYSLGALLYQLLTGEPPIRRDVILKSGFFDIPKRLRETDPVTPSLKVTSRQPQVSSVKRTEPFAGLLELKQGDLDWIVMKALAKDRRERYETALDLARDVENYESGLPVDAHPPTWKYQVSKFVSRNQLIVYSACVLFLGILFGVTGLTFGMLNAIQSRQVAEDSNKAMEAAQAVAVIKTEELAETIYPELINSAWREAAQYNGVRAQVLLDTTSKRLRGWEWGFANQFCESQTPSSIRLAGQSTIVEMKLNEPKQFIACLTDAGQVEIREIKSGRMVREIRGAFLANCLDFSPDGSQLVVGTVEGQLLKYDTDRWEQRASQQLMAGGIYGVAFNQDGSYVAVSTGGSWVKLLSGHTLELVEEWKLPARIGEIQFTTDRNLVGSGLDGNLYQFNQNKRDYDSFHVSGVSLGAIAIAPNNEVLLQVADQIVRFNVDQAKQEKVYQADVLTTFKLLDNGRILAGSGSGELVVIESGNGPKKLASLGAAIRSIGSESPDCYLVGLSDGRLLRVKHEKESAHGITISADQDIVGGVFISKHQLAILLSSEGKLQAFNTCNANLLKQEHAHKTGWAIATDSAGNHVITVGEDSKLKCWGLPELNLKFEADLKWGVRDLCISPDGKWIAAAPPKGSDVPSGTIGIWETESGNCKSLLRGHENWVVSLAASPDGKKLVSGDVNRVCRVWDIPSAETLFKLDARKKSVVDRLAFNVAGDRVYTGYRDGWVSEWNLATGKILKTWPAFGDRLTGLAVTRDGRVLATARSDSRLRVHDFVRNQTVASFDLGLGFVRGFEVSADRKVIGFVGDPRELNVVFFP